MVPVVRPCRMVMVVVFALVALLAPGRAAVHGGKEVKELSGLVETVSSNGFPALVVVGPEHTGAELGAGKSGEPAKARGAATSSGPRPWPVEMPAGKVLAIQPSCA